MASPPPAAGRPRVVLRASLGLLVAWTLYAAYAAALFWPVLRAPDTTFAGHGDAYGRAWVTWLDIHHPPQDGLTPMEGFPFGHDVGHGRREALFLGLLGGLARLSGEVRALNLLWILLLPINALAGLLLAYHITRHAGAAFFTGLAFGFSPITIMQGLAGHTQFLLAFWLPLAALGALRVIERGSIASGVLLGAIMAGTLASYVQSAFFAACLVGGLFVLEALRPRPDRIGWLARCTGAFACAVAVGGALALPLEGAPMRRLVSDSAAYVFPLTEAVAFAARPWNYLLPSIDHPLFGGIARRFAWLERYGGSATENTLYVGVVVLVLALAGAWMFARLREPGEQFAAPRRQFWQWGMLAFVFALLSAPPILPVGAHAIPLPSYLLNLAVPFFRAYARLGIVVAMALAVMAGIALARVCENAGGARNRVALVAAACVLVAIDFWSSPSHTLVRLDPPPVYAWLANETASFGVAEYPLAEAGALLNYRYLFWQRIHGKPLLNGGGATRRAAEFLRLVENIEEPATPGLLKYLGIRYVIVHPHAYEEGPTPDTDKPYYGGVFNRVNNRRFNGGRPPQLPAGLTLVRHFGDADAYRVDAEPPATVALAPGSRRWDTFTSHSRWVVPPEPPSIRIENLTSEARTATVRVLLQTVSSEERVRLEAGAQHVEDVTIGPAPTAIELPLSLGPAPQATAMRFGRRGNPAADSLLLSLTGRAVEPAEEPMTFEAEAASSLLGRRIVDDTASAGAAVVAGSQPNGFPLFFGPEVAIPAGAYTARFRIRLIGEGAAPDSESAGTLMIADVSSAEKIAIRTLDTSALPVDARRAWVDVDLTFQATSTGWYDFRVVPAAGAPLAVDVVKLLHAR